MQIIPLASQVRERKNDNFAYFSLFGRFTLYRARMSKGLKALCYKGILECGCVLRNPYDSNLNIIIKHAKNKI